MVRVAIYGVIGVFVAARALKAMAIHKATGKALKQDPSMRFAVIEEGVLLHQSEVDELTGLTGEARIKLLSTAMRRQNHYMQRAAQ